MHLYYSEVSLYTHVYPRHRSIKVADLDGSTRGADFANTAVCTSFEWAAVYKLNRYQSDQTTYHDCELGSLLFVLRVFVNGFEQQRVLGYSLHGLDQNVE